MIRFVTQVHSSSNFLILMLDQQCQNCLQIVAKLKLLIIIHLLYNYTKCYIFLHQTFHTKLLGLIQHVLDKILLRLFCMDRQFFVLWLIFYFVYSTCIWVLYNLKFVKLKIVTRYMYIVCKYTSQNREDDEAFFADSLVSQ